MRVRTLIAAMLVLPAAAAWAESNTLTGQPGFFKPTPDGDPALTKVAPPPAPQPSVAPVRPPQAPPVVVMEAAQREADAAVRQAEVDLDRAQREHEQAAEKSVQSATTIQGAFTGLTSERDR